MLVVCERDAQRSAQCRDLHDVEHVPGRQLRDQHAVDHGGSRVQPVPGRSVFEQQQSDKLPGPGDMRGGHGTNCAGQRNLGRGLRGLHARKLLCRRGEPTFGLWRRHVGSRREPGDPLRGEDLVHAGDVCGV